MSVETPSLPGTSLSSRFTGLSATNRVDSAVERLPVSTRESAQDNQTVSPTQLVDDEETRVRVAEAASSTLNSMNHRIKFSVHEDSGQTVITIVERDTNEVIRQIPAEEIMRLMDRMEQAQGHIVQVEA